MCDVTREKSPLAKLLGLLAVLAIVTAACSTDSTVTVGAPDTESNLVGDRPGGADSEPVDVTPVEPSGTRAVGADSAPVEVTAGGYPRLSDFSGKDTMIAVIGNGGSSKPLFIEPPGIDLSIVEVPEENAAEILGSGVLAGDCNEEIVLAIDGAQTVDAAVDNCQAIASEVSE